MEVVFIIITFVVIVAIANVLNSNDKNSKKGSDLPVKYSYTAKDAVMTPAETIFYKRLEKIVQDRYYIFPQIHLTALLNNRTTGTYYKAGYQRLQRRSVDYVLCDKSTMKPIYAVELDDSTHDKPKTRLRDQIVEDLLASINLPLVRFRDIGKLSDEQISEKFEAASQHNQIPIMNKHLN